MAPIATQAKFTYPVSTGTTRHELVPGEQEESHGVRQHQPKQHEMVHRHNSQTNSRSLEIHPLTGLLVLARIWARESLHANAISSD
jgi:hypothetical protein